MNRKAKLTIFIIVIAVLFLLPASFRPDDIFGLFGSDIVLVDLIEQPISLEGSEIWEGVSGFYSGNQQSFGLSKDHMQKLCDVFFDTPQERQSGVFYRIDSIEPKERNQREAPIDGQVDETNSTVNTLLGAPVILEIENVLIKMDQVFYNRIEKGVLEKASRP